MVIRPQYAPRARQRGYIIDPFQFGAPPPTDPAFATVVQLAHFDGTDGQTGALTNSCPLGNALSTSGGELDTALNVFGTAALLRTSVSASVPAAVTSSHADYQFGTNDFTIEFRFRIPTVAQKNIFDMRVGGSGVNAALYIEADGRLKYFSSSDRITGAAGTVAAATFVAIALSRVSGTSRLFANGAQVGSSFADSINFNVAAKILLGSDNANPDGATWDELRISNGAFGAGAGRYAANYTPATAAFPDS